MGHSPYISLTRFDDPTNFLSPRQIRVLHGEKHLINSLKTWFAQVTTGHGFMIIGSTLLGVLSGSVSWPVAAPLLVAGAIGLAWPENMALQSASQAAATDVAKMLDAYKNRGTPPTP
jgi:hypothetical protein